MQKKVTLHHLADVYLDEHVAGLKSAKKTHMVVVRDILPHVPKKDINKLTRGDITQLVLAHRNRPGTRGNAFRQCRAMFGWLHNYGFIENNPMQGMRGPKPLPPRTRSLSDDEIVQLWHLLDIHGHSFTALYRLALLTGQRRSECALCHSNEIDSNQWTIQGSIAKNGRPHTIDLSQFLLANLYDHDGLLASPRQNQSLSGYSRAHERLLSFWDGPPWRFHDLRRTFYTGLAKLGVTRDIAHRLVNHKTGTDQLDVVYNQYGYEKEKRDAIMAWSHHVENLVSR